MPFSSLLAGLDPDIDRRRKLSQFFDEEICIEQNIMQTTLQNEFIYVSDILTCEKLIVGEIDEISKLPENWNGLGSKIISTEVICNALKLIKLLPPSILYYLRPDNIYPSKLGTITFDFDFGIGNILSIEIAKKSIGYFVELNHENYKHVENMIFNDENTDNIVSSINNDISIFL
ncbi:hypothetical protein GWA97_02785 [Flavobacterium sp. LaA7.5]|nr:hypothetical protein [Flavobacterium salilacus subsp. altitudinum]